MSLAGLVRFSLTQRLLILLAVALLLPAGWWAFRSIPIDAFPDVSPTHVKIIVKSARMIPGQVETRISEVQELLTDMGARDVRLAHDDQERQKFWAGR